MGYRAWLVGRAKPNQRDALMQAFLHGRVIEECRETIAGFVHGELLLSEDDPDLMCVTVEWKDKQSFLDWQVSPVRVAQGQGLVQFLQDMPRSELYRSVHTVTNP